MTCVVGVVGESGVLLAGDSQSSTLNSNRKNKNPKTGNISEILAFAACGSARLNDLLAHEIGIGLEDPALGRDEHEWTVREFIPHLRHFLANNGQLLDFFGLEYLDESAFLLAVRGRLFTIDGDLQVAEHILPFDALGSGQDVAIGAMAGWMEDPNNRDPLPDPDLEQVAVVGIKAAIGFTNFVGGEITYASTVKFTEDEIEIARSILA